MTVRERRWQRGDQPGRRLFIAVPLPPAARDAIAALVDGLSIRDDARPVRWVRMDGLHLTLRFLGPTPDDRIAPLAGVVDAAAAMTRPIDVTIAGAGAFPSPSRPRALWLGIDAGSAALAQLAARVSSLLASTGWPEDERPFRPHLTLARADGVARGPAAARALISAAADGTVTSFTADRLTLFESHTGGGAARYEPLHEAPLSGSAGPTQG